MQHTLGNIYLIIFCLQLKSLKDIFFGGVWKKFKTISFFNFTTTTTTSTIAAIDLFAWLSQVLIKGDDSTFIYKYRNTGKKLLLFYFFHSFRFSSFIFQNLYKYMLPSFFYDKLLLRDQNEQYVYSPPSEFHWW